MAMIKCPNCKKEISDKSEKCVHCGQVLIEKKKFCPECGNELEEGAKICGNCGCPVSENNITESKPQQVELTKVRLKPHFSKKTLLIIGAIILGIVVIACNVNQYNNNKAEEESNNYKDNLETITLKMLSGAAEAEDCGNLIKSVWSNTIWEEDDPETDKYTKKNGKFNDDFNDSLDNLFSDSTFQEKIDNIESIKTEVNSLYRQMKNPPEEWEEAYSDLKDYYESYLKLNNMCTNPSGNLQSYSTNFSDADSETLNGYNKMKNYLDY